MRRVALTVLGLLATAGPRAGDAPQKQAPWSAGPGDINHPVGVVPSASMHVPEDWPLDAGGALTCRTCHLEFPSRQSEPSLRAPTAGAGEGGDDGPSAGAFCLSCHGTAPRGTRVGAHWMAVESAHIRVGKDSAAGPARTLDAHSRRCLECHDGVSASDAPGLKSASWSDANDHPVAMPYRLTGDVGSDVSLRSMASLPKTVRLPGGNVSCVSCHNLYAGTPGLLSVTLEGSALCFTCHQMD